MSWLVRSELIQVWKVSWLVRGALISGVEGVLVSEGCTDFRGA